MNRQKINEIVLQMSACIPSNANGADKADMLVFLADELGLNHLVRPEALPSDEVKLELPNVAPEFYRQRTDRSEKPCDFIMRVYQRWYGRGLAKHHLLHLDEPLYAALCNWLLRNDTPEGFELPTKKELNDRALEKIGLAEGETLPYPSYYQGLKDKLRLYNAARNRSECESD